jgi:hypothetical protein
MSHEVQIRPAKTMRNDTIALANGSRQQFFMHVEMAMREISIAIKLSSKGQKKNSRLDTSLSAT